MAIPSNQHLWLVAEHGVMIQPADDEHAPATSIDEDASARDSVSVLHYRSPQSRTHCFWDPGDRLQYTSVSMSAARACATKYA